MRYMLLVHDDEKAGQNGEGRGSAAMQEAVALARRLKEEGVCWEAAPLHPSGSAVSVRVREGETLVHDGPFAETREQLGGFFLIEAADLDEAIGIAALIPAARWGTVEVRPIREVPGLAGEERAL
ncbi:MAG TPA: YciI family protein [Candidatus Polarisedimenticolia bacterium]|nr:YciI family protein [Candidatus Polarisedimenticolia bacterium]